MPGYREVAKLEWLVELALQCLDMIVQLVGERAQTRYGHADQIRCAKERVGFSMIMRVCALVCVCVHAVCVYGCMYVMYVCMHLCVCVYMGMYAQVNRVSWDNLEDKKLAYTQLSIVQIVMRELCR